ncbi:MAG: hypothetical protein KDK44_05490 [Chlamydiia bacterium]|nr:hypothetical protein [Chlamydiia bacterium]
MDEVQDVQKTPINPRARDKEEFPKKPFNYLLDEEEEEDKENTQHPSPMALFSPPPSTDFPDVQTISPIQINALSEIIADKITIVIDKGITTTSVEVPQGKFKGSTISIVHYDTNPHSFNVELSGSFEQMMDFSQNMKELYKQLQERMPDFVFKVDAALSPEHQVFDTKQRKQRVQKSDRAR